MIEKPIISPNSSPRDKNLSNLKNWTTSKKILGIGVGINIAIAGATVFLLQGINPTYTSKGATIIPGVGTQGSVELSETGKTYDSSGQTPYGYLLKIDPRENYQYISQTEDVIAQAAAAVNMSMEEFGAPTVWLDNGTTIMQFAISGETPEQAREKAWAFYKSWSDRISDLRNQEALRQTNNIEQKLSISDRQLEDTQQKISEFRNQSSLKIASQVQELAGQIENLRIQQTNLIVEQKGVARRFQQLSSLLNFTSEQAGEALILLDDKVFQNSLQNYTQATANLEETSSIWSTDSPQVISEEEKKNTAQRAMLQRSRFLLGKPVDLNFLARLDLGGDGRRDFVEELVRLQVQREGLETQVNSLNQQIEQLEVRLKNLTQEQFTLERLERDAQIAESIFAEGLSRLDVNKPDYATYYPPIQLIEEPTLPSGEEGSASKTIILGGIAFSILSTTGLLMLWWGKSQNRYIFKYFLDSNEKKV